MKKRTNAYLIDVALDIENHSAYDKGTIGYAPRIMTSMALPMRESTSNEYVKRNGHYKLVIISPSEIGLPYGGVPRWLIIYLTTQAVLTKSNEIYCGKTFGELARVVGKTSSGGANGPITALKKHFPRLFASTIHWIKETEGEWSIDTMNISRNASMLWDPVNNNDWEGFVTLSETFYEDIQLHAKPIDLRVIDALSYYPMAIDIYCFLTTRYFNLSKPILISWLDLVNQSGCSYAKLSNFRKKYIEAAAVVKVLYPKAKFLFKDNGMLLYPSSCHVPSR